MVGLTGEDAGHTGTAHALSAGELQLHARLTQGVERRLLGWHPDDLSGARYLDIEWDVHSGALRPALEVFTMDILLLPAAAASGRDDCVHESAGPTDVDVRVRVRVRKGGGGIEPLVRRAVIEMKRHAPGEGRAADPLEKGGAPDRARTVVHLEVDADGGEPFRHAQNRGDTDAAGQQQVVTR